MIESSSAILVSSRDRYDRPLGITEVGAAVGANVVIYATIDTFTIGRVGVGERTVIPTATARVKVIDVDEGKRAWPVAPLEWQAVQVTLPREQGQLPTTRNAEYELSVALSERLGIAIANLFIDHHAPDDSRVGTVERNR